MKQITESDANLLFEVRFAVDGPFADPEKVWREVRKYAAGKECRAYVVCEGDVAIGYVECKLNDDLPAGAPPLDGLESIGHVARIGVRKEARVRGIGKQLLEQAELWLRSEGKSGACLGYHSQNTEAEAFYARCGYRDVAVFKDGAKDRMRKIAVKKW